MSERLPKFSKKDCIDLLWAFNQLAAEIVDDELLTDIHVAAPLPDVVCLEFVWMKSRYLAYFGAEFVPEGRLEDLGERNFKNRLIHLYRVLPDKVRLDQFLVERFPDMNRSELQRRIAAGLVMVDGKAVTKPSDQTSVDASVELLEPVAPATLELPILYEDADVIVINKPSGILRKANSPPNQPSLRGWPQKPAARQPTAPASSIASTAALPA